MVFVFGFSKNARSNIDKDEGDALTKLAAHLLSLTLPYAASGPTCADGPAVSAL